MSRFVVIHTRIIYLLFNINNGIACRSHRDSRDLQKLVGFHISMYSSVWNPCCVSVSPRPNARCRAYRSIGPPAQWRQAGQGHLENQLTLLAVSKSRRSQAAHAVDQARCQTATALLHSACISAKRMKTYSTTCSLSCLSTAR